MTGRHAAPPPRSSSHLLSSPRRVTAFLVICLVELLVVLDNTVVNVALPDISTDLRVGFTGLQWIVDAYILTFCGLLLAFGNITDRLGRRRMLLIGVVGLAAMSMVGALADNLPQLIASRALMGIFAAAALPATLAVIIDLFRTPADRAVAVGVWASIAGVAIAIGPVSGGWLIEHFTWHSVFWLNVPVAVVAVIGILAVVPESRATTTGPLDLTGVVLSFSGVSLLVYALIEAPGHGWTTVPTLGGIAVSLALLSAFVVRQTRVASPILDVRLFRSRPFAMPALAISIAYFSLFGYVFLITQYFQGVRGYSPLEFGVATLPFAVALAVSAPTATALAQRIGTMPVIVTGLVLVGIGMVMAGQVGIGSSYLGLLLPTMIVLAVGIAVIQGPATESIMSSVPIDEAGAGSAVNDTTRELGGTLGVAVLGSVTASYYNTTVGPLVASVPSEILSDRDREYVNGSVLSVQEIQRYPLPEMFAPVRDNLVLSMKEAAMAGSEVASYIAAAAVFACAVVVAILLPRHHRTTGVVMTEPSDTTRQFSSDER
ncbi:MFS transporter [Rhodococcus sp. BP-349]|uniref:MFS transporter n=1 Tax=unclassified Rhodococcus (in: high G+C Gram-positive bacteria) TaxID=192944 RepID=UPI001C9AABE7|nr:MULTISPECIES: MFS transporter [unclassified Rhodococcus (in: high G+C Gram-positive bacteria)]MBY6539742.1 MFS transporter [Rhodococcus sp. BP-363]MBY6543930.1 MFS transporter [Rhodococcus sp. BP-369]MBY6563160.1 MFS transporter [Rhodococcus sp. BP-370]MBY6577452.1 MFS transporter [Rhodococcus sp. BP-364]MBY6586753.1 MFS transporter [Rhodococcus sp. BP-358]